MKNINIAEILKDCPSGMELDCAIYEDVYFDGIDEVCDIIKCYIQEPKHKIGISFNKYGHYSNTNKSKCVIFPKGKTTWDGFTPPCKFKDADIVAATIPHTGTWVGIFKQYINNEFESYCFISANGVFNNIGLKNHVLVDTRLASEEEQQKLFQAIKDNGYKWNVETKTLDELIEPKFKVGDEIVKRNSISNSWIVSSVSSEYYGLKLPKGIESIGVLPVSEQDNYELLSNIDKFDITTFKPFESKVLVRDNNLQKWSPAMWGYYDFDSQNYPYKLVGGAARYCIPYEGNEHLCGTTNDCDDFYKTW